MTGQLTLDPIQPKPGSVKAAVLYLLQTHPGGQCRRDFANEDIWEVSNRIGELVKDGWPIRRSRCGKHRHKAKVTLYYL